jgi:hypothetical protein
MTKSAFIRVHLRLNSRGLTRSRAKPRRKCTSEHDLRRFKKNLRNLFLFFSNLSNPLRDNNSYSSCTFFGNPMLSMSAFQAANPTTDAAGWNPGHASALAVCAKRHGLHLLRPGRPLAGHSPPSDLPTKPRDKTLRRFTRSQVQARQRYPAAERGATRQKRLMSPKTHFCDKTRRDIIPHDITQRGQPPVYEAASFVRHRPDQGR